MSASISYPGNRSCAHLLSLCALAALLSGAAPAGVAQAQTEATASAGSEPSGKPRARRVGDATSALLQMQADGSADGAPLPMLGAAADLSWQRYLNSFKQPIPAFFGNEIQPTGGGR